MCFIHFSSKKFYLDSMESFLKQKMVWRKKKSYLFVFVDNNMTTSRSDLHISNKESSDLPKSTISDGFNIKHVRIIMYKLCWRIPSFGFKLEGNSGFNYYFTSRNLNSDFSYWFVSIRH
jgi:hypothetical protein